MAESLFSNIGGATQAAVAGQIAFVDDLSRVRTVGPNLFSVGDFASATGFTLGSGCTISGGVNAWAGVANNTGWSRAVESWVLGRRYLATVTISGYSAGALQLRLGNTFSASAVFPASNGTHSIVVTGVASAASMALIAVGTTTLTVDNLVIQEITSSYLPMTQANVSLRPLRGRRPKTGARNFYVATADLSAGAWVKGNTTVGVVAGPGGAAGAWRITADAGTNKKLIRQTTAATAGLAVVESFVVKAGTHAFVQLTCSGDAQAFANFNLTTGAVGTFGTKTTASIVSLGDGWYRCIAAYNSTHVLGSGSYRLYLVSSASAAFDPDLAATGTETVDVFAPQAEIGTVATPYQLVGATNHDITEEGVESVSQVDFDLLDDTLVSPAIAAGLTGQAFVAGDGGMFVSDLTIAAAGTFTIGTASNNWTGATPGVLRAVGGPHGRVLDWGIRAGNFTEAEIGRLEAFYRAQGGKALLVEGPELAGAFSTWSGLETSGTGFFVDDSKLKWNGLADNSKSVLTGVTGIGKVYRVSWTLTVSAGAVLRLINNSAAGTITSNVAVTTSGSNSAVLASVGTAGFGFRAPNALFAAAAGEITAFSIKELIPRGEL
jgi:hypothetical protein